MILNTSPLPSLFQIAEKEILILNMIDQMVAKTQVCIQQQQQQQQHLLLQQHSEEILSSTSRYQTFASKSIRSSLKQRGSPSRNTSIAEDSNNISITSNLDSNYSKNKERDQFLQSIGDIKDEESMQNWWICFDSVYFKGEFQELPAPHAFLELLLSPPPLLSQPPDPDSSNSNTIPPLKNNKLLSILLQDSTANTNTNYLLLYKLKNVSEKSMNFPKAPEEEIPSFEMIPFSKSNTRINRLLNHNNTKTKELIPETQRTTAAFEINLPNKMKYTENFCVILKLKAIFPLKEATLNQCLIQQQILCDQSQVALKQTYNNMNSRGQQFQYFQNYKKEQQLKSLMKNTQSPLDLEIALLESLSTEQSYKEQLERLYEKSAEFKQRENDISYLNELSQTFTDYLRMLSIRKNLLSAFCDRHPYNTDTYFDPPEIAPNIYEEVPKICFSRAMVLAEKVNKIKQNSNSHPRSESSAIPPTLQKRTKQSRNRMIEIDCSVCFHPLNNENNSVVYCSNCSCSFHKYCYGIQSLPTSHYYCQRCCGSKPSIRAISHKKITQDCQLCNISSIHIPIIQFNSQYYHPTCLTIYNYLTCSNSTLRLRPNITAESIADAIKSESQIKCLACQSTKGRKVKCCSENPCDSHIHPLCAFLSGMEVWLDPAEDDEFLEKEMQANCYTQLKNLGFRIGFKCATHTDKLNRNAIAQTYYRCFQINYNGICKYRSLIEYEKSLQYQRNKQKSNEVKSDPEPQLKQVHEKKENSNNNHLSNQHLLNDQMVQNYFQNQRNLPAEKLSKDQEIKIEDEEDVVENKNNESLQTEDENHNQPSTTKNSFHRKSMRSPNSNNSSPTCTSTSSTTSLIEKSRALIQSQTIFKKHDDSPKKQTEIIQINSLISIQITKEMLESAPKTSRKWKFNLKQKLIKEALQNYQANLNDRSSKSLINQSDTTRTSNQKVILTAEQQKEAQRQTRKNVENTNNPKNKSVNESTNSHLIKTQMEIEQSPERSPYIPNSPHYQQKRKRERDLNDCQRKSKKNDQNNNLNRIKSYQTTSIKSEEQSERSKEVINSLERTNENNQARSHSSEEELSESPKLVKKQFQSQQSTSVPLYDIS